MNKQLSGQEVLRGEYTQASLLSATRENTVGCEHNETIKTMCAIGANLIKLERLAAAEKMFAEAHHRATKASGAGDVRVLSLCVDICWGYHIQSRLNSLERIVNFIFDNHTSQKDMETDRAAAIFDAFAAIYDSRGNVIDGERYSDRAYNIYAQISGIGSKEAITSGLRVDRLRRELGQLMDRMKKEHRLETKEEAFTRELEVDIAQKIEEQGKPDPQLLCNLAELYRKRFDDSGKWSCLETAIKWLGTAIELLDCDAPNSGAWKKALCDYQLQASPRI